MEKQQISKTGDVRLIEHGSRDYDDIVALRYEILRKPLNLHFSAEQLAAENTNYHLGLYEGGELIACLMLVPEENGRMRMKQVAVKSDRQGQGIGAKLVIAAEDFSREKGFHLMYCHARDTAVPFYLKLNYLKVGDMFEEVTVPHWEMEKEL